VVYKNRCGWEERRRDFSSRLSALGTDWGVSNEGKEVPGGGLEERQKRERIRREEKNATDVRDEEREESLQREKSKTVRILETGNTPDYEVTNRRSPGAAARTGLALHGTRDLELSLETRAWASACAAVSLLSAACTDSLDAVACS